jgi:hypothetical protein
VAKLLVGDSRQAINGWRGKGHRPRAASRTRLFDTFAVLVVAETGLFDSLLV